MERVVEWAGEGHGAVAVSTVWPFGRLTVPRRWFRKRIGRQSFRKCSGCDQPPAPPQGGFAGVVFRTVSFFGSVAVSRLLGGHFTVGCRWIGLSPGAPTSRPLSTDPKTFSGLGMTAPGWKGGKGGGGKKAGQPVASGRPKNSVGLLLTPGCRPLWSDRRSQNRHPGSCSEAPPAVGKAGRD